MDRNDGESDADYLARLAGHYLEDEEAQRWLALLRPAIALVPGDDVIARLGGAPVLPPDVSWPVWEGHGPLSYVGEIDLAALAAHDPPLDFALPTVGRLLLFFFEGSYDDYSGIVDSGDPSTQQGARLLHVDSRPATGRPTPTPDGVPDFPEIALTGRPVLTFPDWDHPVMDATFRSPDAEASSPLNQPSYTSDFAAVLYGHYGDGPNHQIGGWAQPDQRSVELDAAGVALRLGDDWHDPRRAVEAVRWLPLVQIDSDEEMFWGDLGKLYWLARADDLRTGDLGDVIFTWQGS